MKKSVLKNVLFSTVLLSASLMSHNVIAQNATNDQTLMTIGTEKISGSEFLRIFKKNNLKNESVTKESLENYLNLYVNFRLKVEEAKEMKLDTAKAFQKELSGYRDQLAQPYLNDTSFTSALMKEAFQRLQYDLRVSHILIKLPQFPSPKDTLSAYNKLMDIRSKILGGEFFEKMATEYSEDPYVKDVPASSSQPYPVKGNKGDLGYFSAFDMIYSFENAAYSLELNKISLPVHTTYGYHLIKLTDKQKALGKLLAAHIFVSVPPFSKDSVVTAAKKKIDSYYQMILSGTNYDTVAKKYSEDRSSASNGGKLRWFTVSRMVPEFIENIYHMKQGDISKPIQTQYGWHIIKLLERKPIGSFDELKSEIKEKIAKDTRSNLSKTVIVNKVKNDYSFKENSKALKKFYPVVDTTILDGKWDAAKAKDLNQTLFSLGSTNYTQQNFAAYIVANQTHSNPNKNSQIKADKNVYVNELYKNFVETTCINYLNNQLENKYPDFKALMKEYLDGMLLFELTDKKVWSKSVKDSAGLADFYQLNKNKYMWNERVNATVFTCANKTVVADLKKQLLKTNGKYTVKSLLEIFNPKGVTNLKIDSAIYSKDDNKAVDAVEWKESKIPVEVKVDTTIKMVLVQKLIPAQPKSIDEAKGLITSDYQEYLEKNWITELKKKYSVNINKDVLNALIK